MQSENIIQVRYMGLVDYNQALKIQLDLRDKRQKNLVDDTLLLLQHPSVITEGRQKSDDDFKFSKEIILSKGIAIEKTDRGGRLTYHGPGQLVGYFIFDIQKLKISVEKMVWNVEEAIRLSFLDYHLIAQRNDLNPGIWVNSNKIASIGFHIQKGITTHGISINLDLDLSPYQLFTACGLNTSGVTTLFLEKGIKVDILEFSKTFMQKISGIFNTRLNVVFEEDQK